MRVQAGLLALFSALRGVAALYDLPEPLLSRDEKHFGDLFDAIQSGVLKRSTHDASFPLNFAVTDQVLLSGNLGDSKLTLKCVECKTTGEVTAFAMLPDISDIDITDPGDIFNDSMLGLTFNGVGATVDLDLTAAASGDFSMPLLKTESPLGIAGPGFQIGVVFSIDLVLAVSAQVETEGGFKVAIPDGSSFMILFDEAKPNVANFNGASASLLPLKVDLPAEVTVALRLSVQAGVMLPDLEIIDLKALAGASISIPEVILKESASFPFNSSCAIPVSAELDINAGVFIDVDADLAGIDIGEFNPTATTTLFAASTSTCLSFAGNTSVPGSRGNYSAAAKPTPYHTSFRPWRPTPKPSPGPSFMPPPFMGPKPTTLVTTVKLPTQGNSSGPGLGTPSSFAAATRTYARQTAYPITLQSLATPITNYAAKAAATPVR
ncbi:hypothetical protein F4679DRAFT_567871 [Xylaria curta]|nr:hypothetical protein F4679DRAFT_567871 [Xylaria curta]